MIFPRSPLAAMMAVLLALIGAPDAGATPAGEVPRRVVSINVCTDQLAMLLARPGQLYSVSHLARRPETSVLADRAGGYATNYGRAEDVFLMRPDLVLAGTFTTRATVDMLKRLGFQVELFAPEGSLADIRSSMLRMGALLGVRARADAMVAAFDAELARIVARQPAEKPLAALYYANSYTSGSGTLSADVVEHAGLENLGSKLGLSGTARLPLELLVMARPDVVVTGRDFATSRSEATAVLEHPALLAAARHSGKAVVADRDWVCGLPFTLDAVRRLAEVARSVDGRQGR